MLFNSWVFILAFLPAALTAYHLLGRYHDARLALLCLASLVFYGYWDVRFLPLLVGSVLVNWLLARLAARAAVAPLAALGVAFNLGLLGLFKYADFFAESLLAVTGAPHERFNIVLPLGISFFTFQQISYLVDLKRGRARPYGLLDYFVYVTFFAQLVAGPIVRHNELIPQFRRLPPAGELARMMGQGAVLFIIGLFKKVALADPLALVADPLFAQAALGGALSAGEGWLAALAFALQIYFDFSGYSDMAIGLGLLFGFRLPINFNVPYRATSIRDFWRRWHITLSRFLRDYLYIPLGGNRRGARRQTINLMITMLLGGLWHGAAWTFVAWGGLHGLALAVNHAWEERGRRLPAPLAWAATMVFLLVTWVLFRAESFGAAAAMLGAMVGLGAGTSGLALPDETWWLLPFAAGVAVIGPASQRVVEELLVPRRIVAVTTGAACVGLLLLIGGGFHDEFIYFQF